MKGPRQQLRGWAQRVWKVHGGFQADEMVGPGLDFWGSGKNVAFKNHSERPRRAPGGFGGDLGILVGAGSCEDLGFQAKELGCKQVPIGLGRELRRTESQVAVTPRSRDSLRLGPQPEGAEGAGVPRD